MNRFQKFLCRHSQASIALWVVVGGYLVYLAYQLITEPSPTANPAIIIPTAVIFAVVGAALVIIGLYAIFKGYNKERSAPGIDNSRENPRDGE